MKTSLILLLVSAVLVVLPACSNMPVHGSAMTSVNSPGVANGINANNQMPSGR